MLENTTFYCYCMDMKKYIAIPIISLLVLLGGVSAASSLSAAAYRCADDAKAEDHSTLRKGDTGKCVKKLQTALEDDGQDLGQWGVDGSFGPITEKAVRAFQEENDLTVDGIVGKQTWGALLKVAKESNNSDKEDPAKDEDEDSDAYNEKRGPNKTDRMILTFDGCPSSVSRMRSVARAAYYQDMTLVFAPAGECIKAKKFDVDYARTYGHVVIGHGKEHNTPLTDKSIDEIEKLMDDESHNSSFIRPPHGISDEKLDQYLEDNGIQKWLFTADTRDWAKKMNRKDAVKAVEKAATKGGTVMVHMEYGAFSGTALRHIKKAVNEKDIQLCNAYPKGNAPVEVPDELPCVDGKVE